ncbi:monosaccharide ABC transporter membrane protein (CUT2 family) [Pacificibacter maritimus]|uniref:Monosaccharide ABC transporter membrane protein (CUT2 family) n=1 Tax=Pacificibacter maritimus TaxID=762213 RepID=A0A3N4UNB8_9RHOB|nr:ABC transporter permease [Pacificibacter maritimus]RPE63330.1 monosaccharide ABC transporter membrane protein (CUT2 family) [Pacificibacter maritimus]
MSDTTVTPTKTITVQGLLQSTGIGLALFLLIVFFSLSSEHFLTSGNISNILTQITINLILGVGMTFVILIGGIDLSVGSVLAFSSVVAGKVMTMTGLGDGTVIVFAVMAGLGTGMLCGLMNGAISAWWGLPSFIITLGMLNIARGGALHVAEARTIYSFPYAFEEFGSISFFGIPILFLLALLLVLLAWLILNFTVFGRMVYGIGNNEEAVRLAGHNVFRYKVGAFAICGTCAGLGALAYMARLNIASPIAGIAFELDAIAAVIIGGTSLAGGRGSVIGTLMGAFIIGVLANGLILMGLNDFMRQMITGLVIIVAVIVDYYRAKYANV